MLATKAFDHLLQQVQSSSLNYHLQISPFSAIISLKKSLIKDKAGVAESPPFSAMAPSYDHGCIEYLLATNAKLKGELLCLQKNYKDNLMKSDMAQDTIKAFILK